VSFAFTLGSYVFVVFEQGMDDASFIGVQRIRF